jgi:hypothetical protein
MKKIKKFEGFMDDYNNMFSRFKSNGTRETEVKLTKEELQKELENFNVKCDEYIKNNNKQIKWSIIDLYKIPELLFEDYAKLYYYYALFNVSGKSKQILNFIKNHLKKEITKNVIIKLNENPNLYKPLKTVIEDRSDWDGKILSGDPGHKYSLMVFMKALTQCDMYKMEQDAEKYNL